MKETLEQELKLRVPDGFELPELEGEALQPRVFVSTYHDTPGLRLARAGATLRHRVESGKGLWQLKLPRGGDRAELEVAGGPTKVPAEIGKLLTALTHRAELVKVARLRTRRAGVRIAEDGRALAEVVLDSVSVLEGRRVARTFEEVEVELVEGDTRTLERLGKVLRRAGAGKEERRPKVVQALDLDLTSNGDAPGAPSTPAEALKLMVRRQYDQLLAHDAGVRLGTDPEDLHQFRVATRRLRAVLRAAAPLLVPEWADRLRAELRWLGGALGPLRDLDVLLAYLRRESETLEPKERVALVRLFGWFDDERENARAEVLKALESPRYLELLDSLEAAAETPHLVDSTISLETIWRDEHRRLRRAMRSLGDEPGDDELHETRIRAKRARYAAELAEPLVGAPATRYVAAAKRVQDALGEHQDAAVAGEQVRRLVSRSRAPDAHFAAGRLVERQENRRRAARAELPDVWGRLQKQGRRIAKAR